jgi:peroxiredoxin
LTIFVQKIINSRVFIINMKLVKNWILVLLIAVVGCNSNPKNEVPNRSNFLITVSGTIENGEDQLVTLDKMGATAFIPMDSTRCDEKGEFKLKFDNPEADFFSIKYSDNGFVTLIAKPGDNIVITGSTESLHPYTVEGSDDSRLVHDLSIEHKGVLEKLKAISDQTNEILGDDNYSGEKLELNRKYDSITQSFQDYSVDFITQNSSSLAILFALYNQYGPRLSVFQLPLHIETYQIVDSCLFKLYPDNEAVTSLHMQLITVREQVKLQQSRTVLSPGMLAPDFVMKTNKGDMLSLSDLRGKYVLLQFWASWSKPSLDENILLSNCHNRFQNSSFAILQVSIDNDKRSWLKAIRNLEEWNHVSDLNRWESSVVDLYEVERIPANFLINPRGVIVEKDIFGEDLTQTIGKYIK